jgi:hypothetical protein
MIALLLALLATFTPMQCLGDVDAAVVYYEGRHTITDWQPFAELAGRDIWVDATYSFDIPDGIERRGRIYAWRDNRRMDVWIWGAGDELYLFVFDDYYNIHPCAAGAVSRDEFVALLDGD